MRRLFENKLVVFLVAATIILVIIMGVFSKKGRETSMVEGVGGTVSNPVQGAISGIGGFFTGIFDNFGNAKKLREENEQLRNENTNLQKQIRDMKGLEDENYELRSMLNLREKHTNVDLVAAAVTSKDPSNWYSVLTINRGTDDGVEKNQPVVNSNKELVGQISRVGGNWAEVVTILDSQSSVGALISRSNELGIIEGDANLRYSGMLRLAYISRDANIEPGDFVETSGLGGVFPKGLLIGNVIEVYDESATMSKAATIEPLADISKINEVFVITGYDETEVSEDGRIFGEDSEEEADSDEDEEESEDGDEDYE